MKQCNNLPFPWQILQGSTYCKVAQLCMFVTPCGLQRNGMQCNMLHLFTVAFGNDICAQPESACACVPSTDSMGDTFVCMCKCCKAVSKDNLLSMLRNPSIYLSIIYPSIMPASYLLLCEVALNVQQNIASVLSVFCQA